MHGNPPFHRGVLAEGILIAPTWRDIPHDKTEILIQLDPGLAFGTGYHPTTRLTLELLERTVETASASC